MRTQRFDVKPRSGSSGRSELGRIERPDETARQRHPITGSPHSHLEQHLVILLAGLRLDLLSQANDGLEVGVVGLLLYAKIEIAGSDTEDKVKRMARNDRAEFG